MKFLDSIMFWPIVFFFGALYLTSMFIYPWFEYGNWEELQNVWARWQGLNMGVLAFFAAILGLKRNQTIAAAEQERLEEKHQFMLRQQEASEEEKRYRKLRRGLSLLPLSLSQLSDYCQQSMRFLSASWHYNARLKAQATRFSAELFEDLPPPIFEGYQEVFSECMEHGGDDLYDYLSKIIRNLQVHFARMKDLPENLRPDSRMIVMQPNIIVYLYRIAEVQVLINRLFGYSRDNETLDTSPLSWEEFGGALRGGDVTIDAIEDLQGFIERTLDRERSERE